MARAVRARSVGSSITLLVALLPGCGGADGLSDVPVAVWTLSTEPLVDIGVVEGDPDQELFAATSSVRLRDGRIVVANTGSNELRFYEAGGRFVRAVGRRGRGPGEFRGLRRVYQFTPGTLLALDGTGRVSMFDTAGVFLGVSPIDSVSQEEQFPADVWLFRRYWIEGGLLAETRTRVRNALRALPLPDGSPAYRYVSVDDAGHAWIREFPVEAALAGRWTVVDPGGRVVAVVETPRSFEPHHIGEEFVLGRWRDESDVNFIRFYALERSTRTAHPPPWVRSRDDGGAPAEAERARLLEALRASLRAVVNAQERYYAEHRTYAMSRFDLEWDELSGVAFDLVTSSGFGWNAVAAHRDLDVICGMGIGLPTPPGWVEGSPSCAPN